MGQGSISHLLLSHNQSSNAEEVQEEMGETAIQLILNRAQRAKLFAHLVVSLYSLTLNPLAPKHKARLEIIHEVTYRLHRFCLDESEETAFWLSPKEVQLVQYVLLMLKPI